MAKTNVSVPKTNASVTRTGAARETLGTSIGELWTESNLLLLSGPNPFHHQTAGGLQTPYAKIVRFRSRG